MQRGRRGHHPRVAGRSHNAGCKRRRSPLRCRFGAGGGFSYVIAAATWSPVSFRRRRDFSYQRLAPFLKRSRRFRSWRKAVLRKGAILREREALGVTAAAGDGRHWGSQRLPETGGIGVATTAGAGRHGDSDDRRRREMPRRPHAKSAATCPSRDRRRACRRPCPCCASSTASGDAASCCRPGWPRASCPSSCSSRPTA